MPLSESPVIELLEMAPRSPNSPIVVQHSSDRSATGENMVPTETSRKNIEMKLCVHGALRFLSSHCKPKQCKVKLVSGYPSVEEAV